MRAEVVAVGTELLLGQIADTNAQVISQALAEAGIDVFRHVAVGDNIERIAAALGEALGRADAVIVTGGLGPTPDDITREAVAAVTGLPLQRDARLEKVIESVFERLGRVMPESNRRQADLPRGARPIEPQGTAPGFMLEHEDRLIVALPGVPWEMRAMLAGAVVPELARRSGSGVVVSRHVLVLGLGESSTHEKIGGIVAAQSNPTIAYLASAGQVRVRITAKAPSTLEAEALIAPVEAAIRERLGDDAAEGSHWSVVEALLELLENRGLTIAAAESLTGGAIGAALTGSAGSSASFVGSLVCYTPEAKRDVAGIDPAILEGPGAVSEEAAEALARAAARVFSAAVGVAATGVAGPAEHDGKPVGTVFVAASFDGRAEVRRVRGYGDRDNIRALSVAAALDLARRIVLGGLGGG